MGALPFLLPFHEEFAVKKTLIALLTLGAVAFTQAGFAADAPDTAKKLTPQQEKMKNCSKDAKDKQLKGDDRKQFMKSCLSGKAAPAPAAAAAPEKAAAPAAPDCAAQATSKKLAGAAKASFLKKCQADAAAK